MTEKGFLCCDPQTVVETKQGKLRGYLADGVYAFHGIRYAQAKRFQLPQPVEPWSGVKDALAYGYVCPLLEQDVPFEEVRVPHRYWPADENCQYLNIWTTRLDRKAKMPVMVWLHGGGFFAGSSIEQIAYEGDHLAKYGEVVVVSLNHRLNILGYLDLSPLGEKYAGSANAGNADMVAALKWIQENIEMFGGDPGNVTLFGQSGGGMKVWTLMNTPEADGLFHKGIIQSGVVDGFMEKNTGAEPILSALLQELKLKKEEAEKLESLPYSRLAQAYRKVSPALSQRGEYIGGTPVADGWYLGDPREIGFSAHGKTIPVLIGTVFGEFTFNRSIRDREGREAGREQTERLLETYYGSAAGGLKELFERAYPGRPLSDLPALDVFFRVPAKDFIEKMARQQGARVYSYLFAFDFPFGERCPAWHCAEIPFVFHNTDRIPICSVPGVSERLEEKVCSAWVSFARHGRPEAAGLPEWPACRPGQEAVMILDETCEVRVNHDNELLEALLKTGIRSPFLPDENGKEEILVH